MHISLFLDFLQLVKLYKRVSAVNIGTKRRILSTVTDLFTNGQEQVQL